METTNKIVLTVVGVVVSVLLICTLMIPVIESAKITETETIVAENPIGLPVKYNTVNPNLSGTVNFYNFSATEQHDDDDNLVDYLLQLSAGSDYEEALRSSLPEKFIVYSDNNTTIYIDGNKFYSTELNITGDITGADNFFQVYYRNGNYTYGTDAGNINAPSPIAYYYEMCSRGDYSNFAGDNPPAMETPSASINGVYIGEKVRTITTTVDSPYSSMLDIIPILMIAGLIIAVTGLFVYRRL